MNNLAQFIKTQELGKKSARYRGLIWRDGDTQKLLHVWSQPEVLNGFLVETRKQKLYMYIAKELSKIGVKRRWEECQSKIKNLKREFTKYKESGQPEKFRFYKIMEKILTATTTETKESHSKDSFTPEFDDIQPIQIQFEVIQEQAYQSLQGHFPVQNIKVADFNGQVFPKTEEDSHIEIVHHTEEGIQFSQNFDIVNHMDTEEVAQEYEVIPETDPLKTDTADDTPVILFTTSISDEVNNLKNSTVSSTKNSIFKSRFRRYDNFRKRHNAFPVKRTVPKEIHREKKLKSLSERMAETVDRILTQTTNSLIDEMKASEERYIKWEETKRLEDQKREEIMFQKLMVAIKERPNSTNLEQKSHNNSAGDHDHKDKLQRNTDMIKSSNDAREMTFDLLTTNLANRILAQQKDTEQTLRQWEAKMQHQELQHNENLFSMMISAVSSKDANGFP